MRKGRLALTRRPGETIQIKAGEQVIDIELVRVAGNQVKLAFNADREVKIVRGELEP